MATSRCCHKTIAFATHTHADHFGGMHEFEERVVHRKEVGWSNNPARDLGLRVDASDGDFYRYLADVGYVLDSEFLITALPEAGYDPDRWVVRPAEPTWVVEQGDVIDLGNRVFEVLHLRGHSPGSAGLWEARSGALFSGDAVYDGPLLDQLPDSSIADYIETMRRLMALPVSVVHAGHDPSFGRQRLHEIASRYIEHGRYVPG